MIFVLRVLFFFLLYVLSLLFSHLLPYFALHFQFILLLICLTFFVLSLLFSPSASVASRIFVYSGSKRVIQKLFGVNFPIFRIFEIRFEFLERYLFRSERLAYISNNRWLRCSDTHWPTFWVPQIIPVVRRSNASRHWRSLCLLGCTFKSCHRSVIIKIIQSHHDSVS